MKDDEVETIRKKGICPERQRRTSVRIEVSRPRIEASAYRIDDQSVTSRPNYSVQALFTYSVPKKPYINTVTCRPITRQRFGTDIPVTNTQAAFG
jgi:hypothetical protein